MKVAELFARPLIVGASVSADYAAPSPGKIAALRMAPTADVRIIARNGTPGAEVWKRVTEVDLRDRTLILGVDLFFWDSTILDASASLRAIDAFAAATARLHIPSVLGDIPDLMADYQPHRTDLNHALQAAARGSEWLRILSLDQIYRDARSAAGITFRGKKLGLRELVPDRLHTSRIAGEFLAEELVRIVGGFAE